MSVSYVYDTFTDTNNTAIDAHFGEIGATWTIDSLFGQAPASSLELFRIHTNRLRRTTFAENPAADGGDALVRPSGTLPGGTAVFSIEMVARFLTGTGNAEVSVYQNAIDPGNGELLFTFRQNDIYLKGTGGGSNAQSLLASTDYTVRLDVNGSALSVYLDNTLVDSSTLGATPIEPFGIALFDGNSDGDIGVSSFNVFKEPGAFWTDFVKTVETA